MLMLAPDVSDIVLPVPDMILLVAVPPVSFGKSIALAEALTSVMSRPSTPPVMLLTERDHLH